MGLSEVFDEGYCDGYGQAIENVRYNIVKYIEKYHEISVDKVNEICDLCSDSSTNNKYTDISKLPDDTFFYVNNGAWQGFVTTENGEKVCYAGATKKNPTKEYVHRFVIKDSYELSINILSVKRRK